MAHWKIRFYYQGTIDTMKDWAKVQECLETYLYKYPGDEVRKNEAYDVLVIAASHNKNYEAMLYYSELHLRRNSDYVPMMLENARALKSLGDIEKAKEKLETVIKKGKGTPAGFIAEDLLKELER
jgi:TolA-binding protein